MAKKATKKTAARRKPSRKPVRRVTKIIRGTVTIGTRKPPVFENLDAVRILNGGSIGVVTGVLSHYKGDPDYAVRFMGADGIRATKYFAPGEIEHA